MGFDYVLHSLIVAKRCRTPGWLHRPTTIGVVAIVALSATATAASSGSVAPSPQKRAVARTYTASNWPDLLQRHASSGASPSAPSAVVPAPTGPVVGAVDLCTGANEPPNAALTGDTVGSNGATHHATVVLTGVATQSADASGLNSLLPTITGATQGVTGALGLTIPSLPSHSAPSGPDGHRPASDPVARGRWASTIWRGGRSFNRSYRSGADSNLHDNNAANERFPSLPGHRFGVARSDGHAEPRRNR